MFDEFAQGDDYLEKELFAADTDEEEEEEDEDEDEPVVPEEEEL